MLERSIDFRYASDLGKILGPDLARAAVLCIVLKDKRLTYFAR